MRGREWGVVAALFVLPFCWVLLSATDYGATYDEPHYASAGSRYAAWWARVATSPGEALTRDAIYAAWRLNHEHPPLQKVASGFSYRWLGDVLPGLTAMRLPSALWYSLAICALFLFVRGVWGFGAGLVAAIAFATLPRIFAHAHFDALDMPMAAWFFITAAATAHALRRNSWGWAALAGGAFGLALLAKVNALFLPVLLISWALIWHRHRWPKLLAVMLIGPAVFFAAWPWLWIAPIAHMRGYLAFHFGHAAYNVWYLGKLYQLAPWHYPFVIAAVTTPALVLIAMAGGIATARPRRSANEALLLLGLAMALIPSALPSSPKYNGERLFLPAFPFIAAFAGGGFAWAVARLRSLDFLKREENARLARLLPVMIGAGLIAPSVIGMMRTHPYQLAYYNAFVGGTAGATKRGFETIYWGQVLSEGVDFVNQVETQNPRVLVIPKGVIYLLELQHARKDIEFTADESEAGSVDYVMFQCMQSDFTELCWRLYREAQPSKVVEVDGTPLLVAYDREAVARVLETLRTQMNAGEPG